jgi:O-antigen/teichoic acid export membrane protein
MSLVKKNIAANFAGSVWTGLMSLLFVPLYIRFMGIEAYGLIGIFASLLALLALLDMGLGNTLNREMSRLAVQENKAQDMRDLLRSLEIPYWGMGLVLGAAIALLSPVIAYHWVQPQALSPASVQRAIVSMGIATAFQWPMSLYAGGLMGLQRQLSLNGINIAMSTCRGLGAVLVLWLVSPTVQSYFTWQIVMSAAHTSLLAFFLWRNLPCAPKKPRFRGDLIRGIWRFAAGITMISLLSTILNQMDKVILSRLLTLREFSYYSLASMCALNLGRFIGPVQQATYPRLSNLVSLGAWEELTRLYHKSAQLVSVLTVPAACVVALFSRELLQLWIRDPVTVAQSHMLLSVLVTGTALWGMMFVPYSLQLAFGWTRLSIQMNFVAVLVLLPGIALLTKMFGALGAATVWVVLNSGYLTFGIHFMHKRLIPAEKWCWYREDVGLPWITSVAVAGGFRLLAPVPGGILPAVAYIVLVSTATLCATALATSVTRAWLYARIASLARIGAR